MQALAVLLLLIILLLFPLWVAIQAWRKDYKKWSVTIGLSFLIPLAPTILAIIVFFLVKAYEPEWDSFPSPKSYCGCGTMYYGALKREPDGSFITTLWFSILYFPLIPIQSYRVLRGQESSTWQGYIISSTTSFYIKEVLTLYAYQVILTYTFFCSFVVLALVMMNLFQGVKASSESFVNVMGGLAVVYVIIGYFLLRTK